MPIEIGQRVKKVFTLAKTQVTVTFPGFCENGKFDCHFMLPAYANGSTDDLQNDKFALLILAQDWTTAVEFILQKNELNVWVDKATITNNTYGEYRAQGYYTKKPKYSSVTLYWKNVLAAFGIGEYRIQVTQTTPLGDEVSFSKPVCLREYTCTPDNTIRLEWWNNKGIGDIENDREILDYTGTNFYYQIRIPYSFFGYPKSEYTEDEIQYENGQFDDVVSVQSETYILKIGSSPAWLHNVIKTLAFQSGTLQITDYSNNNPHVIIRKRVKRTSGFEPRYTPGSRCAPVTAELKPTYNRLEIYPCL